MFDWHGMMKKSQAFRNGRPFPFCFVENVLDKKTYDRLYRTFPKVDDRWYSPNDMSRSAKKRYFGKDSFGIAVDREDPTLSKTWNDFHHYLFGKEFVGMMSEFTGIRLKGLRHFIFIVNGPGSFNMPHTHWGESRKQGNSYILTCLIYFTKGWQTGDPGGTYVSKTDDEGSIMFEPYNLDNSMVCFKETPQSWHGSRYMIKNMQRQSIQFTVF